jgi:hypothetical protein
LVAAAHPKKGLVDNQWFDWTVAATVIISVSTKLAAMTVLPNP